MEDNQSFLDLQVDEDAGTQLTETSRWAKLLAVIVLSVTGIFTLALLAVWGRLDTIIGPNDDLIDKESFGLVKLLVGVLFAFLIICAVMLMIFLLKGTKALKGAIQAKDPALLNTGLGHFRNYFTMMGVLALLALVLRLLVFLIK